MKVAQDLDARVNEMQDKDCLFDYVDPASGILVRIIWWNLLSI